MATDIQVKYGDKRDWTFALSDASNDAFNLTGATVQFKLRKDEGHSETFFVRNTGGTGSDFIAISTPASDGEVTITPTSSDWSAVSDYGVYVGEFSILDSNSILQYTKDILIDVQQALI